MINHIGFFTVPADRPEAAEAGLQPLERIAHADLLEVRRNLLGDDLPREIDLGVYGAFADAAALARYKSDPIPAQAVQAVGPVGNCAWRPISSLEIGRARITYQWSGV
jgi:hypothetical protein